MNDADEWIPVTVVSKTTETLDIANFVLRPQSGQLLPYEAGAHIDVEVGPGLVRQYSLCRATASFGYEIGVLREAASRGGSKRMVQDVDVGSELRISAPRNHFSLDPRGRRSILIAGGIGITPIMSMAEALHVSGADFEMHYCARSPGRMAFRDRLLSSPFADKIEMHFDDGPGEQRLKLMDLLSAPSPGTHIYTCGPAGMIEWVLSTAEQQGWPKEQVHREFFAAPTAPEATGEEFFVEIRSTGQSFHILADQTIMAVLAENGVHVPTSCEQGICGTCITKVVEGAPDHRDFYLTDEEHAMNDRIAVCCSRAKTPKLVLDL